MNFISKLFSHAVTKKRHVHSMEVGRERTTLWVEGGQ